MSTVISSPAVLRTTLVATQGPPGPPGANGAPGTGGVQTCVLTAARDLSGHRVVVAFGGADYADPTDPDHADLVVGITTGAALSGDDVIVQAAGEMVESTWNWSPGPVWCGALGTLTQTAPTSGWSQIVATALAPTRILITGRQALNLA